VERKSGSKPIREGAVMEKNRDKPNDTPSQKDFLLFGYKGLIVAMLEIMMKDVTVPDSEIEVSPYDSRKVREQKKEKKGYKRSAYRFVRSEWFDDLCWYIGINPHPIRRYAIERYNESKKK
jgi:hypothetical protein